MGCPLVNPPRPCGDFELAPRGRTTRTLTEGCKRGRRKSRAANINYSAVWRCPTLPHRQCCRQQRKQQLTGKAVCWSSKYAILATLPSAAPKAKAVGRGGERALKRVSKGEEGESYSNQIGGVLPGIVANNMSDRATHGSNHRNFPCASPKNELRTRSDGKRVG
eukprot:364556-Chlamydomonas_euryale.AAC.23